MKSHCGKILAQERAHVCFRWFLLAQCGFLCTNQCITTAQYYIEKSVNWLPRKGPGPSGPLFE